MVSVLLANGCLSAGALGNSMLQLATSEMPPYQTIRDGKLDGIAVKVLKCVLAKMKQPYLIAEFPWRRAQMLVEAGIYDGFFAASRTRQRDSYAVLSEPIADQAWNWYFLASGKANPQSKSFKTEKTVSALANSSMEFWLAQHNYRVNTYATTMEQLFNQLLNHRVDAVLSNEAMAREYLKKDALPSSTVNTQPFSSLSMRDLQLGVYFSRAFLATHTDFLMRFNKHIQACR